MAGDSILEILIRARDEATAQLAQTTQKIQDMKDEIEEGSEKLALFSAGITAALGFALKAAADVELQQLRLNAAIRGAGTAVDASKLNALAVQLQDLTGIDADATVNAQALLATFKLTENQILDLTPRLQNLSKMYGIDMNQAALQLGKALQTGNVDILKRWGVVIDEARLKGEGFNYLLQALDENTGPIAEMYGKSFPGAMERFSNSIGDVVEMAGGSLVPVITAVANQTQGLLNFLRDHPAFVSVVTHIAAIVAGITGIVAAAGLFYTKIIPAVQAGAQAFMLLAANPITGVVLAVAAVIAVVVILIKYHEQLFAVAGQVINGIKNFFLGLWQHIKDIASAIGNVWETVWGIITGKKHLADLRDALSNVVIKSRDAGEFVGTSFSNAWGTVKDKGAEAYNAVVGYFAGKTQASNETTAKMKQNAQEAADAEKAAIDAAAAYAVSRQQERWAALQKLIDQQLAEEQQMKEIAEAQATAGSIQATIDRYSAYQEMIDAEVDAEKFKEDQESAIAEEAERRRWSAYQEQIDLAKRIADGESESAKAAEQKRWADYQKFLDRKAAADKAAAEVAHRIWDNVQRSFNDSLSDMLKGQATFKDVVQSTWNAIKEQVSNYIADMVTKFVLGENAKRLAIAGTELVAKASAAVMAWLQSTGLMSVLANVGAAMIAIFGSIKAALAALWANPLTWWLAGAVAVALGVAVYEWSSAKSKAEAAAANTPKFEKGGFVNETGLALVHAGEFVLPRPIVQMLAGAGAGGGNIYVTVTGNHVYNPADEDRLARKVSQEILRNVQLMRRF